MKIEGIPSNIEACHHHDVTIELRVDKETMGRVVDALSALAVVGISAYGAKKVIDLGYVLSTDLFYRKVVWKR